MRVEGRAKRLVAGHAVGCHWDCLGPDMEEGQRIPEVERSRRT